MSGSSSTTRSVRHDGLVVERCLAKGGSWTRLAGWVRLRSAARWRSARISPSSWTTASRIAEQHATMLAAMWRRRVYSTNWAIGVSRPISPAQDLKVPRYRGLRQLHHRLEVGDESGAAARQFRIRSGWAPQPSQQVRRGSSAHIRVNEYTPRRMDAGGRTDWTGRRRGRRTAELASHPEPLVESPERMRGIANADVHKTNAR